MNEPFRTVEKPWGREEWFFLSSRLCMKKLVVNKGHRLSLQFHKEKDEGSYIVSGLLKVETSMDFDHAPLLSDILGPGDWWHCPPNTVHRIEAIEDTVIIEASTQEIDDVVRLEDDYGR